VRKGTKSTDPFLDELRRAYVRLGASERGILLGVSGGADSTALLVASAGVAPQLRLRLEVACLNHGLRPEAASEVHRVHQLAKEHGLAFHTRSLSLAVGAGLEARAREARYAALEAIRTQARLDFVATAHTASDQAETLLMRLSRGSSTRGAASVLEQRGRILRPLLAFLRSDVEAFLGRLGIPFVQDPMNEDPKFLRTRIRRDVLPVLTRAAGEGSLRALARFARLQAEDAALLDGMAQQAYRRLLVGPACLDAAGVRALLPALRRRVLATLLAEAGVQPECATLDRAMSALAHGRSSPLARRTTLKTEGGLIRVSGGALARAEHAFELKKGWNEDPVSGLRISLSDKPLSAPAGWWTQVDTACLPMFLRRRSPGDCVLGPSGRRKLQDLLVDRRVQSELRDVIPIICDAKGEILWVVGVWPRRPMDQARKQGGTGSDQRWYLCAESSSGGGGAWIETSL